MNLEVKNQLSFQESIIARDAALNQVAGNAIDFIARGTSFMLTRLEPGEYTGEDIRLLMTDAGICPHHHNAWGALIMGAVRLGILTDTGKVSKMRSKKSHARKTSVYRK